MTAQAQRSTASMSRRSIVLLTMIAAAVVGVAANAVVAFAGIAAGASPAFAPLSIAVFGPFTVLGLVAGYLGWRIVRARAANPLRLLRILVPVLLVLSFVPDTISAIVGFIPDSSTTGFVALMIMHPIVAAVGVPVYQRLSPAHDA
ncbi:MAG TPA: DUF6069 family protein [Galbitalea sp.]|jgi:hypothetical protein|nr:DUF6069 family protein [Galbitalea sp.]